METTEDNLAAIKQLLTSALLLMDKERAASGCIEPWIISDVEDALNAVDHALHAPGLWLSTPPGD